MDKKKTNPLARFRGFIQAGATLLTNIHLPNFAKGTLYQGSGKYVCVPGLNCYSCPGAAGACPVGAFQAVVGSSKFRFSYYITGILILFGVLLGRFICGFLCPFGWLQELLHKIPAKKLSTRRLRPLTYVKYAVLLVTVVLLPMLAVNDVGMGDPYFCKYLCPQGVLEGAIPLSIVNAGIRSALGSLFTWKLCVLLAVRAGPDAHSAADALRMVGAFCNIHIHLAGPGTLAAGDAFILVHLHLEEGYLVEQGVEGAQPRR